MYAYYVNKNIYKREEERELALTKKAKTCPFSHQAGMTDTYKASFPVKKKQCFPKVTQKLSSIIVISSWSNYFFILQNFVLYLQNETLLFEITSV